jgi:hypothetical protein
LILGQAVGVLLVHSRLLCKFVKGRALGAKRKIAGGILAFVGFMLSPLSWWNDLFVNVPLALVFAWVVSAFDKRAFGVAVVVGYWLTNVLGFVLMHKGAQKLLTEQDKRYSRRELLKDVGISLLYTGVIIALIKFGVLKPLGTYFQTH